MKQTTFTVTAETVFRITRAENDGQCASCGELAELRSLDEAIATAKALTAATPGATLDIKTGKAELLSGERSAILCEAIRAAQHSISGRSYPPDQAAIELIEAALAAISLLDRRASF